jgi:MoaA/NifB/PqqE/SkfB family radical SAM enzyme
MNAPQESVNIALTAAELAKREGLKQRKPYIAEKLARIVEMEERGEVSPIIRLEKSYLCNFQCTHCSAEYYMDRHLEKVLKIVDERRKLDLDDIRRLSRQADELGLARFVITGGEPLVMKDFDDVVAAIDPDRHYIVTDTNGWFLDDKRARHIKSIGVEKVQLSLDSFVEAEHDAFRNKPGSYKRVMRAIDAALDAGLNLILSTVLVKGRVKTQEFRDMCEFAQSRDIGLYVSYAKPTGSCSEHPEFVIDKEDADLLREFEKDYKVFTHMTPSYGSFKGCITVKGIITITSASEVTPCPYIDFSLGNIRETPLKEIIDRGMRNPWLGPHRPDCLIGEDPKFIRIHAEKTHGATHLPLRWGVGFSDADTLVDEADDIPAPATGLFDSQGRCIPRVEAAAHQVSRQYFKFQQPAIDLAAIHSRVSGLLGSDGLPTVEEFERRIAAIRSQLESDSTTANLLHGVGVPILLPRAAHPDIGAALDEHYIPAVESAFTAAYPGYAFANHHKAGLAGKLTVAPTTRHQTLLDQMRDGAIVGLYFPCLTEYSQQAAREQMAALPNHLLLAGGFDTCAALIAAPDLLLNRDAYPPLLWLAGLDSEKAEAGYHFEAYGYNMTFNRRLHFGEAAEYWASGIVVLG